MNVVLSPSNLQTFRQCPRRFYGQSITKELVWRPSKQKTRGTQMHSVIEQAMQTGWTEDTASSLDSQVNAWAAKDTVDFVTGYRKDGYDLRIEHELCVDMQCRPCGWWDEKAGLRAKADVVLVPRSGTDSLIIGDIKTGKNYKDTFQCRLECLLGHIIYEIPICVYYYWYIDTGDIEYGEINFSRGLADVQDVLDTIKDCRQSIKNNYYPAVRNKFCGFCDWHKTKECGL